MTTLAETYGEIPDIEPINVSIFPSADADTMATLAAEDLQNAESRYIIDSEDRANWLLKKIGNIDAELRRVQAQVASILRGLEADEHQLRARFEAELAEWAGQEITRRGGKGKTLKLMQGTVAFRTVPATLKVTGTTEAMDYAKAQGWDVVKVVESLDALAYKQQAQAALAEDGELLPGVEVVPERQTFNIRFKNDSEGE